MDTPMKLNGIERIVRGGEPSEIWPGTYNVSVEMKGKNEDLNSQELFKILEEEGIVYSGKHYGNQHRFDQRGFNDKNLMGEAADEAKANGKSHIWIGIIHNMVCLGVLPEIYTALVALKGETHLGYAERVLDKVVTFVESEESYN